VRSTDAPLLAPLRACTVPDLRSCVPGECTELSYPIGWAVSIPDVGGKEGELLLARSKPTM
jgi:hypothetical protein